MARPSAVSTTVARNPPIAVPARLRWRSSTRTPRTPSSRTCSGPTRSTNSPAPVSGEKPAGASGGPVMRTSLPALPRTTARRLLHLGRHRGLAVGAVGRRRLARRRLLGGLRHDGVRLALGDRAGARGVEDVVLDPGVAALERAQRELVGLVVVVAPQLGEERVDAPARLAAEEVGELRRLLCSLGVLGAQRVRVDARRRDAEELGADVDDAPQPRLLALELRLPAADAVEGRAGELARRPLGEAQVPGELAELRVGAPLL